MKNVIGLDCVECSRRHVISEAQYVCATCGGNLDVKYDYESIRRELNRESLVRNSSYSMWRYRSLLPIESESSPPPLHIGWTPIYSSPCLSSEFGVGEVLIKDDGRNPTASFKDRPSALALVKAVEAGAEIITTASSGNAGSALAGICASVDMKSVIFVPHYAPPAKVAQLQIYGATVVLVEGSYDEAFVLCLEASRKWGWYQRNTGYNPYTREGKKTAALEIAEQLNWEVPDKVFVAVGDGNIFSGLWKGFSDLLELGLIDRRPQMIAVQAEGASAIVDAANGDGIIKSAPANTIADSINVGRPNDGTMAIRAIKESGGTGVKVSDDEMKQAVVELARATGVFAEPAAAGTFAGFKRMCRSNRIGSSERVLLMITGNGLKDIEAPRSLVGSPITVRPDIDELAAALKSIP